MITAASLQSQKSKELAQLAREKGIPGWHSMRKAQLIGAILEHSKKSKRNKKKAPTRSAAKQSTTAARSETAIAKKIRIQREQEEHCLLYTSPSPRDRG